MDHRTCTYAGIEGAEIVVSLVDYRCFRKVLQALQQSRLPGFGLLCIQYAAPPDFLDCEGLPERGPSGA